MGWAALGALGVMLVGGCTAADDPSNIGDAATQGSAAAELAYIAPPSTSLDADLDSPVAPYVMARGAGPSAISPDGQFIATRLSLTGTLQLYVMDVSGENLQQLSFGSGITFFEFSPTGALVFGSDNNGDERENYWLIDRDGEGWGAPRIVLPAAHNGFRQFGGFTGDGSQIVYSSTERNGSDFDIYKANIKTGEAARIYEGHLGNYVQAVAPDGKTAIITEAVGEDADRLYVLDMTTGTRRILSGPDPRANHSDAGVDYNGPDQITLASNRGREFAAIEQINLNAPSETATPLFAGGADVDQIKLCGDRLLFTVNRDGFSDTYVMTERGSERSLSGLPRGVHSVDCAGDRALIRVSAANIPGDLFTVDLARPEQAPVKVMGSDYDGLNPENLILPQSVRLPARDGVQVQGLLYLPQTREAKLPVVFMVHGGPTAQARPSYNATVQYLLSRGIAVFQTNVRGSTGFGRTYATLDDRKKRLDSVRDLVDMLSYLETYGRVDTSRAAVMGGSYGGYVVNAVLADYPDAFDAGIALFGVGDWVTALEVASPALKASDLIEYGDIKDPMWRDYYTSISPIAKAGQIRVPVLYSHGEMDPRIDIAETEIMVRALRENGIRADFVRIPDEGHGWRKLSNRLFYERIQAEFLEEVLAR